MRFADCQSATQQATSLRYKAEPRRPAGLVELLRLVWRHRRGPVFATLRRGKPTCPRQGCSGPSRSGWVRPSRTWSHQNPSGSHRIKVDPSGAGAWSRGSWDITRYHWISLDKANLKILFRKETMNGNRSAVFGGLLPSQCFRRHFVMARRAGATGRSSRGRGVLRSEPVRLGQAGSHLVAPKIPVDRTESKWIKAEQAPERPVFRRRGGSFRAGPSKSESFRPFIILWMCPNLPPFAFDRGGESGLVCDPFIDYVWHDS